MALVARHAVLRGSTASEPRALRIASSRLRIQAACGKKGY